ncbi:SPOR domain-containing protein [Corallincola platygyrae]|uniref:SPOR domain-containing protein n=1 Tax=Corallincola platygyrae TaxID=1193278 RepID=A0ABW4XM83_9GAMM
MAANSYEGRNVFNSQLQLQERLGFLVEFDSNIVLLQGPRGAGKTHTLVSYLSSQDGDISHALISCGPNHSDGHYRQQILTQLVPNPLFDESDSLLDSFTRMLEGSHARFLLVLDDADLISETLWLELVALVNYCRASDSIQMSVIAAIEASSISQTIPEDVLLNVSMPPLTPSERREYLSETLGSDERKMMLNSEAIERLLQQARTPESVLALANKIRGGKVAEASFPWKHAALAAVIAIALISLVLWEFDDNTDQRPEQPESIQALDTVEPLTDTAVIAIEEPIASPPDEAAPDVIANADEILPPQIDNDPLELEAAPAPEQQVVVELPDELLQEAERDNLIDTSPAVEPNSTEPEAEQIEPEPLLSEDPVQAEQPALETPLETVQESKPEVSLAGEQLIATWPASGYTLQLGVFSDEEVMRRFNQREDIKALEPDLVRYAIAKNGNMRHVILLGSFATRAEATAYLEQLPETIKKLKPWTKQIAAVHKDIDLKEPTRGE